jgi:hypothetical protein
MKKGGRCEKKIKVNKDKKTYAKGSKIKATWMCEE